MFRRGKDVNFPVSIDKACQHIMETNYFVGVMMGMSKHKITVTVEVFFHFNTNLRFIVAISSSNTHIVAAG